MNKFLTIDTDSLKEQGAFWTAKEIAQQPTVWQQAFDNIVNKHDEIQAFLTPILALNGIRVLFTGAGTSAYVGDTVAPYIAKKTGLSCKAISTTDIVGTPEYYLQKEKPTLLISFARSGNSPESIAAVELANQLIDDCYHLVITCNNNGELANGARNKANALSLIMPEGTLDESFAMTSSFTSMMVSVLSIFTPNEEQLSLAINAAKHLLAEEVNTIKKKASNDIDRIVFLGSGTNLGIAREAALKYLELTAGKITSYCESPLGFRHGPKSIVNNNTDIIIFQSNNNVTRRYTEDLYNEVVKDNIANEITCIDEVVFGTERKIDDIWAGFPFIVYCQMLAFYKSMSLNLSPDNPCPTGEVNRVVQGVTIYPYQDI
ncbi:SIS domain-containing protein [Thalassotalea sp. PP2-459]|uniref:SIS domain-containing protein n=1 Tax=Thalassotalea sp. PP2-459 TaxID=1742724 RepID=UPI0009426CFA|nr:SIS domain-containing protein [Thalassotalea sp. PP2-459]OKY26211.1 hypothetical protein BI291_13100 [Thalassotalea sp. PP2-459]